jgi:hypothetical protein
MAFFLARVGSNYFNGRAGALQSADLGLRRRQEDRRSAGMERIPPCLRLVLVPLFLAAVPFGSGAIGFFLDRFTF